MRMRVLTVGNNDASSSQKENSNNVKKMKIPLQSAADPNPSQMVKSSAAVITNNGNHWIDEQLREGIPRNSGLTVNGFSPSSSVNLPSTKDVAESNVLGLATVNGPASACSTAVAGTLMPITNGISGTDYRSTLHDIVRDDAYCFSADSVLNTMPTQPTSAMPLNTEPSNSEAGNFASSVMGMPANSFASASKEFEASISTLEACIASLNTMSNDVAFVVGERTAAAAAKIHTTLHKKLREIYRQQNTSPNFGVGRGRSRSGLHQHRSNPEVDSLTKNTASLDRTGCPHPSVLPKLEAIESVPAELPPDINTGSSFKPHSVKFDWNLVEELRFRSSIAERGVRTVQHAVDEYATDSSSAGSSDDEEAEHGHAVSFDDNKWCGVPIKRRSLYRYAEERARLMKHMKYCNLQTFQLQNWFRQLVILRHMHKQSESSPIDPFHLVLHDPPSSNQQSAANVDKSATVFPQHLDHQAQSLDATTHCSADVPANVTSNRCGFRGACSRAVETLNPTSRSLGKTKEVWWSDFK